jgi:hypothetical protein
VLGHGLAIGGKLHVQGVVATGADAPRQINGTFSCGGIPSITQLFQVAKFVSNCYAESCVKVSSSSCSRQKDSIWHTPCYLS